MRQVLFRIPLDGVLQLGSISVPWFGFGLLLALWIAFGFGIWLWRRRAKNAKWQPDDWHSLITWSVVAGVILIAPLIAPRFFPEGIPIFGYGFMMFLGFVSAVTLAGRRAEKEGLSPETIWDLAPWILIAGILGARIFFCLEYPEVVFADCRTPGDRVAAFLNLSRGGLVLYGGMLGAAVGYFEFCRRRKLNPLGLGDLITPSVFIGVGFGRIGCLLNGCCYGDVCHLPWAIRFPQGSVPFMAMVHQGFIQPDAPFTPWLHPTQIYIAVDGFLIAALTLAYAPYRRRNGEVFALGLMVYATTRFLIEFLRGDEPGQLGTGLTVSQLISIGMFVTGLLVTIDRARRPAFRQIVRTS